MLHGVSNGVHLLDGRLHELAAVLRHLRRGLDVAADRRHRLERLVDAGGERVDFLLRLRHEVHLLLRRARDLGDGLRDALCRLGGLLRRLRELPGGLVDGVRRRLDLARQVAELVEHRIELRRDIAELVVAVLRRCARLEVTGGALLGGFQHEADAGFDLPHEVEDDANRDEDDNEEHDDRRRADAGVRLIRLFLVLVDLLRVEILILDDDVLHFQECRARDVLEAVFCLRSFSLIVERERLLGGVLIGRPVVLQVFHGRQDFFLAFRIAELMRISPVLGRVDALFDVGLCLLELTEELRLLGRVLGDEQHRRLEAHAVQAVR